ncbi:hypothetical protein ACHAXT_001948 [Thalassiosira profunda]
MSTFASSSNMTGMNGLEEAAGGVAEPTAAEPPSEAPGIDLGSISTVDNATSPWNQRVRRFALTAAVVLVVAAAIAIPLGVVFGSKKSGDAVVTTPSDDANVPTPAPVKLVNRPPWPFTASPTSGSTKALTTPSPTNAPTTASPTAATASSPPAPQPSTSKPTSGSPTSGLPTTSQPTSCLYYNKWVDRTCQADCLEAESNLFPSLYQTLEACCSKEYFWPGAYDRCMGIRPPTNAPVSAEPSNKPSIKPTASPITAPPTTSMPTTARPTTALPTTAMPTNATPLPTPLSSTSRGSLRQPTPSPTNQPTPLPTRVPSVDPTPRPVTNRPPALPTKVPSAEPTKWPSKEPSAEPTKQPTKDPTKQPTSEPTKRPSKEPTKQPTKDPTKQPTSEPTKRPTAEPTKQPTRYPTKWPTRKPTRYPTKQPTRKPTKQPTRIPTRKPTRYPTRWPTNKPTEAQLSISDLHPRDVISRIVSNIDPIIGDIIVDANRRLSTYRHTPPDEPIDTRNFLGTYAGKMIPNGYCSNSGIQDIRVGVMPSQDYTTQVVRVKFYGFTLSYNYQLTPANGRLEVNWPLFSKGIFKPCPVNVWGDMDVGMKDATSFAVDIQFDPASVVAQLLKDDVQDDILHTILHPSKCIANVVPDVEVTSTNAETNDDRLSSDQVIGIANRAMDIVEKSTVDYFQNGFKRRTLCGYFITRIDFAENVLIDILSEGIDLLQETISGVGN